MERGHLEELRMDTDEDNTLLELIRDLWRWAVAGVAGVVSEETP